MRWSLWCLAWGLGGMLLAGCQSRAGAPNHEPGPGAEPSANAPAAAIGANPMTIQLTSSAFREGAKIPGQYAGEGSSPPLAWSGLPDGIRELALICDDPDAPTPEPWVHWVIYKIPLTTGLPEGLPKTATLKEPPGDLPGPELLDRRSDGRLSGAVAAAQERSAPLFLQALRLGYRVDSRSWGQQGGAVEGDQGPRVGRRPVDGHVREVRGGPCPTPGRTAGRIRRMTSFRPGGPAAAGRGGGGSLLAPDPRLRDPLRFEARRRSLCAGRPAAGGGRPLGLLRRPAGVAVGPPDRRPASPRPADLAGRLQRVDHHRSGAGRRGDPRRLRRRLPRHGQHARQLP